MSRSVTHIAKISDVKITLKPGANAFKRIRADDKELLLEVSGSSYGFRYEETQKGNPKYTLPLTVPEEFADALYKVAERLGNVDYSPVYETEDDSFLVYVRVPMNSGGLVFAYIHDVDRRVVKPSDRVGVSMNVRAIIKVDSLRVEGDNPKITLSLIQAEVEDSELVYEDLLS